MTACIGWDGPCPMYGQFHGCVRNLDTPHADRQHVCDCGARTPTNRARSQPAHAPLAKCGTEGAYMRHLRAGEPPCPACRAAHAERARHRKAARNPQEDT